MNFHQCNSLSARRGILTALAVSTLVGATFAGAQTSLEEEPAVLLDTYEVNTFRDSLAVSRAEMRESQNLVDVIAADSVGKLPDANIAEALGRVTSVYLRPDQGEGRYVSIRGVDPILNNVTVNGQNIAVSDTDGRSGRAAPLDVLSASSISRIKVSKVTTPDMDAQSIGGAIDILTPSAFDYAEPFLMLNGEYGYNDFGTESDIHAYQANYGNTFGDDNEWGVFVSGNYWFREYLSHLYENPRAGNPENAFTDQLVPDRVRFGSAIGERERFGYTANLEYRPSDESRWWLRSYYTKYTDIELRPEFTIRNRGDIGATSPTDFYWTRYRIENETREEKQVRPVEQVVLGGEQDIGGGWTLDGNLNYTKAREENPFLNYYETETQTDSSSLDDPAGAPVRFSLNSKGYATPVYNAALSDGLTPNDAAFHEISRIRHITSEVEEETWTADLNALWEGQWNGRLVTFKTGLKYLTRDKFVDDTDNRFPYEGPTVTLADAGLGTPFRAIGRGEAYAALPGITMPIPTPRAYDAYRAANPGDFGFDESGSVSNSIEDDYTLEERITAAYLMGSVQLTPEITLAGGFRVERTEADMAAFTFFEGDLNNQQVFELINPISDSKDYTNVLPSITLRWDAGYNWLFRASVSTNIARPDYPDAAPISTLDAEESLVEPGIWFGGLSIGNPALDPYESINYDASLDYFFDNEQGVISLGAFYKRVDNAIYGFNEVRTDTDFLGVPFGELGVSTLNNAKPGHIAGLELTYQQDFASLPAPFDGFGMLANVSFIDSEVEVFERPGEQLPFFNQADLIYNLQLFYEKHGFSIRFAYNYQSEAIFDEIGGSVEEDIYRDESNTLDAKASYQFNENWSVYLSAKNLTDEPDLTYRNGNRFFVAENPGFETYGREFRLGFTWRM